MCSFSSVLLHLGVLCCLICIIYIMEARQSLSRDDILAYRQQSTCTLDLNVRSLISQLRLRRRGCRAGASYRQRLHATPSSTAYARGISVIVINCRQNRNVNKWREARISVLQPVRFYPSSDSNQCSRCQCRLRLSTCRRQLHHHRQHLRVILSVFHPRLCCLLNLSRLHTAVIRLSLFPF